MCPDTRPANVVIYGFDQALASTISGAFDLFAQAGVTWQRIHHAPKAPVFSVSLVSATGADIRCANGMILKSSGPLTTELAPDILLIPTIGGAIDQVLRNEQSLYPLLRYFAGQNTDIAANCTGVFLLAQAGVLDHRQATTHWGLADEFMQRFPQVELHSDKLHTVHDRLFCAGGGMAWIDLALLFIERYAGAHTARETAKAHVLDLPRLSQSFYAGSRQQQQHHDSLIHSIQNFLNQDIQSLPGVDELATRFNLTSRTLNRRFRNATGFTPGQYIQQLKVDQARKLLETKNYTMDQILSEIGYEDASSFSRLFKRKTGCSPSEYRSRFKANGIL
ncbi:GlxA family transcriptional regulator [Salinimonas lutimaris]|uniref:GlxA family transcriptional regulator n=1 Tax=Salinimonas lutimaris TaxID=914153 RepID=UPI0010BF7BD6|nr:helix-turn-helix domain-containing protein [Salinimonas lutimaris]